MTWPPLRSAAASLVVVCAFFAADERPQFPPAPTARPIGLDAVTPDPTAGAGLPAGFSTAIDFATVARFVRVVASDIDRDGDIDVVASVGTLDLLVWANDGTGHFSRLPASQRQEVRAQPPAPSFDDEGLASNHWIHDDHSRGAYLEPLSARVDEGPQSPLSGAFHIPTRRFSHAIPPARAPPDTRSL